MPDRSDKPFVRRTGDPRRHARIGRLARRGTHPGNGRLRERLHARPANVALLRRLVVTFARRHGAGVDQRDSIALAVSEALSIVVRHAAAQPGRTGLMEVCARMLSDGVLQVAVVGDGCSPLADGGMGVAVITRVSEHLDVVCATPGPRVRMTFTIA